MPAFDNNMAVNRRRTALVSSVVAFSLHSNSTLMRDQVTRATRDFTRLDHMQEAASVIPAENYRPQITQQHCGTLSADNNHANCLWWHSTHFLSAKALHAGGAPTARPGTRISWYCRLPQQKDVVCTAQMGGCMTVYEIRFGCMTRLWNKIRATCPWCSVAKLNT